MKVAQYWAVVQNVTSVVSLSKAAVKKYPGGCWLSKQYGNSAVLTVVIKGHSVLAASGMIATVNKLRVLSVNALAPNDVYICRTAQLASRRCI